MHLFKKEKVFKFKIDNEEPFTKPFKQSTNLKDVREELAKDKNYLKADKLQFIDKDGTLITYECEKSYNLEEICDGNSIIHVKNFLKNIDVYIDDSEVSDFLDPNVKLEKIRDHFKRIKDDKGDFFFRKPDGSIAKPEEEISRDLKKILKNNDTLYISTLQDSDIIICIYSDKTSVYNHTFKRTLHKGMYLSQIRSELANSEASERMRSSYHFSDQKHVPISEFDEDKKRLYEILHINEQGPNVLKILKEDGPDLARLVNKCGYGFIIDKDSATVKQIKHPKPRAFTVKTTQPYIDDDHTEGKFECKSEFHELCKRNFITFGNANFVLPLISISFGIDQRSSREKLNFYETYTKYSYLKKRHATMEINESNIILTDEFKHEVEAALEGGTRNKIVTKLKDIANKYGHFYARSISFGGVSIEKIANVEQTSGHKHAEETRIQASSNLLNNGISLGITAGIASNTEKSKGNARSTHKIKGGDISQFVVDNPACWINSLKDSDTWDIIEYRDIYSIFDLLKDGLRNKVLKTLGKRILKVGIEKIKYPTDKNKPYGIYIGRKLDDISNIENCEIFTTVMKERNRHIFSSYVAYDAPDAPVIFIQRIPSQKKPKKKYRAIEIGWIVVGYPDDTFDLDISNQVMSGKYGNSSDVMVANPYTISNIPHQIDWPNEEKFVTIYVGNCFESNMYEKEVRWNYMNRKDKIFCSILEGINTDENKKLIFANQLFENPECSHHGVINIALGSPDYLLRGPLTKPAFKKSKLDILYLNYPQEKDHMYLVRLSYVK
ncbi:8914_t:CDS:2 [Dentiscutata erythropus]|uniref:8914_t:CDS:1 n=1 Tax=Dentiscutata erythropus TaxID=1348616 RepID=A0A9N9ES32_9GLOM|nr:8914_t:CDS:2 [Dentiscutata erythropus]